MGKRGYRGSLKAAREEFARLLAKRKAIDERLVKLSKTIASLEGLVNEEGPKRRTALKLGDACRFALQGSRTPRTPVQIRGDLAAIGFPVEQYQNVLASIHTTLKRLVKHGEAEAVRVHGKTTYLATHYLRSPGRLELYW